MGTLSLDLFNRQQEPLIVERHDVLLERARQAHGAPARVARIAEIDAQLPTLVDALRASTSVSADHGVWYEQHKIINALEDERRELARADNTLDYQTAITDLRLYRAQWRRVLAASLYFLQIDHAGGQLHKIGVTARPIEERIAEIAADLLPLVGAAQIKVINVWPHRGNVELYFKYRYADKRASLATLTEYYQYGDDLPAVKRDLSRMGQKELSAIEQTVLRGDRSAIEQDIENAAIEVRRRAAIKVGMARSASMGKAIGRPRRASPETPQDVLARDYAAVVLQAIERDPSLSLRKLAAQVELSVNTVRKVLAARDADRSK